MKQFHAIAVFLLGSLFLFFSCCDSSFRKSNKTAADYVVADAFSGATGLGAVPGELPDSGFVYIAQYIADFLHECKIYYVATVDINRPKVRPVGLCFAEDSLLWFNLGSHKASWKELERNHNVEISGYNSKTGETIRVWGEAVMGFTRSERFLEIAPNLKKIYNDTTGNKLGTFYLTNAKAEIAGAQNRIFEF